MYIINIDNSYLLSDVSVALVSVSTQVVCLWDSGESVAGAESYSWSEDQAPVCLQPSEKHISNTIYTPGVLPPNIIMLCSYWDVTTLTNNLVHCNLRSPVIMQNISSHSKYLFE